MTANSTRSLASLLWITALFACDSASEGRTLDFQIRVTEIAVYQGVKRALVISGNPARSLVPLVAERDALLRVYFEHPVPSGAAKIDGKLTLQTGDPIYASSTLNGASTDADITSTLNFRIPQDRVKSPFAYAVDLVGSAPESSVRWPNEGLASVPVDGVRNTLRVLLVPFSYHADGSGRVPDLSPEQLARYRSRLLGMFPVSSVELGVRTTERWTEPLGPAGEGWQDLGFRLFQLRQEDRAPEELYYYGVFNPAESLAQYCTGPCMAGLTVLNDQPPELGRVDLRLALGVGFQDVADDTAAHELGHAHGLSHAPCGSNLDAATIDKEYPYEGGTIGVTGYDIVSAKLLPQESTDIMGYCEGRWISDYHFRKLFARGSRINGASILSNEVGREYEVIGVDGSGNGRWRGQRIMKGLVQGRPVSVRLSGTTSEQRDEVLGRWLSYDHLPGGLVFVPKPSWRPVRAEIVQGHLRAVAIR